MLLFSVDSMSPFDWLCFQRTSCWCRLRRGRCWCRHRRRRCRDLVLFFMDNVLICVYFFLSLSLFHFIRFGVSRLMSYILCFVFLAISFLFFSFNFSCLVKIVRFVPGLPLLLYIYFAALISNDFSARFLLNHV